MPTQPSPARVVVGEVIAIGDELTSGQRLDTNTQWLSQRLTEQGVLVRYHTTVADDFQANVDVFRAAARRADVVVATGGLGPTADDLTRDAMAAAAGVPLVEHAELVSRLEAIFTSRGRQMPPQNRRQAQLPEGAAAIDNPGGTAPGVDLAIGRCRQFALPGVPAEMREMYAATVAPAVARVVGAARVTRHWLVKCFGAGESHVESLIPEIIARGREPLVGITASKGTITLRVTASGATESDCWAAMRPTLDEVRAKLGELIFAEHPASAGGEMVLERELHHTILEMADDRDASVSVVESMTRGLLGRLLAEGEAELQTEFHGRFLSSGSILSGSRYTPSLAADQLESLARGIAEEGWALVIGSPEEGGRVPIAVATQHGVAQRTVQLVGHPSIHRHLVAKHALNLLRLELLRSTE
ncbi:molybdopterin-binding protein [Botrimarina sp.]|uniref:competence/damage-inducible protein A n=1 Tax=Botrimarina sp. TaxID=2795802 RepID=UPI0032EAF684